MQNFEQEIGTAKRIEYSNNDDKVYVVFEITHPKWKQTIKTEWSKDIEFKIMDKKLILEEKV